MRKIEKISYDLRKICYLAKYIANQSDIDEITILRDKLKSQGIKVPLKPIECLEKGLYLTDRLPLTNQYIDKILYFQDEVTA